MGADMFRNLHNGGADLAFPVRLRGDSPPTPFRHQTPSSLMVGHIPHS